METTDRGYEFTHKCSRLFDRIAQACLGLLASLVVFNILLGIFWKRIVGTYEIVSLLMGVVIAFALPYCAITKGHPAIDLFIHRLPKRIQTVVDGIVNILSIVLFGTATYQLVVYGSHVMYIGELSPTLHLPLFVILYLISLGVALLCLVLIVDFYQLIKKGSKQ